MNTIAEQATTSYTLKVKGNAAAEKFQRQGTNSFLFSLYLLWKLPMGFLARLRVRELDRERCRVTVPYNWLNKNPFRSTYFAVEAMAAEMSTGAIIFLAMKAAEPVKVSTLVVGMESTFIKKAVGLTSFTCTEGYKIFDAIERAIQTGEAQTVKVETIGTSEQGEELARFSITWSFKKKRKK